MQQTENNTDGGPLLSRRSFLGLAATAAGAFSILSRQVLGGPGINSPSPKLNIAGIGVGGKGLDDLQNLASENIVALRCGSQLRRSCLQEMA